MIYHISPNNDLKQISSVLGLLKPGDEVAIESGYDYKPFTLSGKKGIKFSKFGSKRNPSFGSLFRPANFKNLGGGMWSFTNSNLNSALNLLLIDGVPVAKGRYPYEPDKYLPVVADSANDTYVETASGELKFPVTGEAVIRLQSFITNTYKVTGHSGNRVSYQGDKGHYPPKKGYGFFIQNQKECLKKEGDWMYDAATKTVTLFLGDKRPDDLNIQVPANFEAAILTGCEDIHVNGLDFLGANGDAVLIKKSLDLHFRNSGAGLAGAMGIKLDDGNQNNISFEKMKVAHAFAGGIYATYGCNGLKVIGCEVTDIGMIAGGSSFMNNDAKSNGICLENGRGNLIQGCLVERVGFNAYVFRGAGTKIVKNRAFEFCKVKADGAGYYSYGGNSLSLLSEPLEIIDNIAAWGYGNVLGTLDHEPNCQGFYLDDNANRIHLKGYNVSAFNPRGLYAHNTHQCDIREMLLFGNKRQLNLSQDNGWTMRGNIFKTNTLVCDRSDQSFVFANSKPFEVDKFGEFSDNRYLFANGGQALFNLSGHASDQHSHASNWERWKELVKEEGSIFESIQELEPTSAKVLTSFKGQFVNTDGMAWANNTLTKSSTGRKIGYMAIGPVTAGKYYRFSGKISGDVEAISFGLEKTYEQSKDAKKPTAGDFSIILPCTVTRTNETILFLCEARMKQITITDMKVEEVVLPAFEPNVILNIARDGEWYSNVYPHYADELPIEETPPIEEPELEIPQPEPEPIEEPEPEPLLFDLPTPPEGYRYQVKIELVKE